MYSKGKKIKKYRFPFVNYSFRLTYLSFFIGFFFIPLKNKVCAILYLSSGLLTYTLLTENNNVRLFKIFRFNNIFLKKSLKLYELVNLRPTWDIPQIYYLIFFLKSNLNISLIELYPLKGIQYTRSSGSKSTILKMDTRTGYSLVRLSSGLKKVFSIFSLVMLNSVVFSLNKNYKVFKSSFKLKKGLKPSVRGVAKNPVDHPHGGRTKSIKYPRTPWGKTTKYK